MPTKNKKKKATKPFGETLPKLYKKTSTGATQEWEVLVDAEKEKGKSIAVITSKYGQVKGKIQTAREIVRVGKNIGKSNETTPLEQARQQAESTWKKKQDKGYVIDIKDIDSGGKNADIRPMLAHKYEDKAHTIEEGQMVYLQPKLDGIRCIAKMVNGVVSLHTRNGKAITAVPHVNEDLQDCMEEGEILDGELYHCDLEFNDITSLVRSTKPKEESGTIEYHIFDTFDTEHNYYDRHLSWVDDWNISHLGSIRLVPTFLEPFSLDLLDKYHDDWVAEGYEGAMIRIQGDPGYEQKRTKHLLKYKKFQDEEFEILSYEEGTAGTKLDGHLGAFYLETDSKYAPFVIDKDGNIHDGKRRVQREPGDRGAFKGKPDGPQKTLKKIWEERDQWKHKKVTVTFQNYSKYGIPRFPIVKGLRWEEDL